MGLTIQRFSGNGFQNFRQRCQEMLEFRVFVLHLPGPLSEHRDVFKAEGLPTGLYFFRPTAGNFRKIRKGMFIKRLHVSLSPFFRKEEPNDKSAGLGRECR